MRETTQTQTEEEAKSVDGEAFVADGFPDRDAEFDAVMDINEQMMSARDEWSPPEKPEYEPNADAKEAAYEGIVRAIDREGKQGSKNSVVKFGLDTGDDELEWVEVEDTGDQDLSNPYVQLCKMYDVHPESVQDFYNKKILVCNVRYMGVMIRNPYPVLGHLWSFGAAHYKHSLFKIKQKSMEGVVPTHRFFVAYVGAVLGSQLLSSVMPILGGILLFLSSLMLMWGVYAKARYDIAPYALEWGERLIEKYKHGDLL